MNKIKKKRVLSLSLVSMMLLGNMIPVYASESSGKNITQLASDNQTIQKYEVVFKTDEHASVDVFYTKDYTTPNEVAVNSAFARQSDTGAIDISGDGQVNFRVNLDKGYEISKISADKNYKNLKGSSDTGIEGIYRLTKVTGPVIITIETKEKENMIPQEGESNIVINEVESNGDTTDWVEIYNKGSEPVDISGWYITDDNTNRLKEKKTYPLSENTILNPGQYFVFDQNEHFNFGLGAPDEVNLYNANNELVVKYSWSTHASGVYARIPDGTGNLVDVSKSTKGSSNGQEMNDQPLTYEAIAWPGSNQVDIYDEGITMFKQDSSGLDFYNNQLYCINNKNGTFWVMDVAKDGTLSYAKGFSAAGKNLAFKHDASNPTASNPDAEGITVDGDGNAYAATERDNNKKDINDNAILKFDPWIDATTVVASMEWNITNQLPDVVANQGIEAVEWVPNSAVDGKLYDMNTKTTFDHHHYPNATAAGVFFVALEANGHIYAFVLNDDSTSQLIADIDSGIGKAMALDYDDYEDILWVGADNDAGNISAKISFNQKEKPDITLVNPPKGMDITRNNEGFAIAPCEYTVNGLRPVYHFMDGMTTGVLSISYLYCDYQAVHTHSSLKEVKALAPTFTSEGHQAYWICEECGKWFSDENAMIEIKDHLSIIIPKIEHRLEMNTTTNTAIHVNETTEDMLLESIDFKVQTEKNIITKINVNEIDKTKIQDTTLMAEIDQLEEIIEKSSMEIAQYLDINITVCDENGQLLGNITETKSPLSFEVIIPNELVKDGRVFQVAYIHQGKVAFLPTTQVDNTLTFESNQFSTYAIVYKDTKALDVIQTTTADTAPVYQYTIVASVALFGTLLLMKKREENITK